MTLESKDAPNGKTHNGEGEGNEEGKNTGSTRNNIDGGISTG